MPTETVNTATLSLEDFDKLMQEIADATSATKEDVEKSVGDADGVVRITRNDEGEITEVAYGAAGGRRSRLNKKTRRSKGRRRHSVRRKLRKLSSRRR
jgi:hypothetical protein